MTPSRKERRPDATAKWLAIVGIGEDGLIGLGEGARRAIGDAEFVFGGRRHLQLAQAAIAGEARAWPVPFDVADVLALCGRKVCVLASGDPFNHGVGATLARHVAPDEMAVWPAPSAFALAAARLGWPLQEVETISLHGRPIGLLRPLLHPATRIVALTSNGAAPASIAALLARHGFGTSRLTVLECLGGARERISSFQAGEFGNFRFDDLNVVAIEVSASPQAGVIPLAAGLVDDLFEHDGQITKREIRAVTLSSLAPRRGELLWDIGAGSGSIAIAWMLAHPSLRAVAIEADAARAARIAANAASLGVPGLRVVEGSAPTALDGLPAPDAIFVGGGCSRPDVMQTAIAALRQGGRLVANAVTLEAEASLLSHHARIGGELIRLALSRAAPLGAMKGWRPAMPVTQWIWSKP